jgi:putative PIN family toxin of toxin-antitoxin system
VVLDTKVIEAALRSRRGASFAVLSAVGTGRFEIALSVPLVLEYESVLRRTAARSAADIANLVDYLCNVAHRQEIFYLWRPRLGDPKDEMVLELAVASDSDAIVTHNQRDFLPAREFGISVVSPAQFLKQLGDSP